jgi:Tfp pilus assembly protein PilN
MKRINLLPPEARVKASRERGLLYAVLLLVLVVAVLGLVYVWQGRQVGEKQAELDQLNTETAAVQAEAAALAPYALIQTERTNMSQTARSIYDARVRWSTILQELSLVIPEEVRLQTLAATVPATMQPGAPPAAGPVAETADVTFTGQTLTHEDVAEFMTRLGLIPQLKSIKLVSSAEATDEATAGAVVTFTVTAALRPYAAAPPATTLQAAVQ